MAGQTAGKVSKKAGKKRAPTMAAKRKRFLEVLRRTNNVSRAAREAGIGVSTVYQHRAKNEAFRVQWDEATTEALDELEAALMERALAGVEKKVFYAGKECGSVRHYSDALAMFMLRSKRPEIYGRGGAVAEGAGAAASADMSEDEARAEVERRLRLIAQRDAEGQGA